MSGTWEEVAKTYLERAIAAETALAAANEALGEERMNSARNLAVLHRSTVELEEQLAAANARAEAAETGLEAARHVRQLSDAALTQAESDLQAQRERAERAEGERDKAVGLLRKYQYGRSAYSGATYCVGCGNDRGAGHRVGCDIALTLQPARIDASAEAPGT